MAKGKTIHQMQVSESIRLTARVTTGGSNHVVCVHVLIDYLKKTFTISNPHRPMGTVFSFENQTVGSCSAAVGGLITKAAEVAEKKLAEAMA